MPKDSDLLNIALTGREPSEVETHRIKTIEEAKTIDEINALGEILEEEVSKQTDPVTDNQPVPESVPVEDKPAEETKLPEAELEEKPPVEDKPSEKVEGKFSVIDDNFILSQPEEDRKILESIKGEILSAKALKNYVNAQRLIGKKSAELQQVKQATKQEVPQMPETYKPDKNEFDTLRAKYVEHKIKQKFPDRPTDVESLKTWESDLNYDNPRAYYDYITAEKQIESEADREIRQMMFVQDHYTELNKKAIELAGTDLSGQLTPYGVNFGDLNMSMDADPNNTALENLLFNGDEIDKNVLVYAGNNKENQPIYLINKDSLVRKFWAVHNNAILNAVASKGKREGFNVRSAQKVTNSLATDSTSTGYQPLNVYARAESAKTPDEISRLINEIEDNNSRS